MDTDVNRIISFWFDGVDAGSKWFRRDEAFDAQIRDQFGGLVEQARASNLTMWTQQPRGTLALLLLLDQFPRNLFRESPLSFSSDAQATEIATQAIAEGYDREVPPIQQCFFYIPLMHDERLVSQVASVALFEALTHRCGQDKDPAEDQARRSMKFAMGHRDVIARFGRFPARNAALGRRSTTEEIEFLKENPSGL